MKKYLIIFGLIGAAQSFADTYLVEDAAIMGTTSSENWSFVKVSLPTSPSSLPSSNCGSGWIRLPNDRVFASILAAKAESREIASMVVVETDWYTVRPAAGGSSIVQTKCLVESVEFE